MKLEQAKAEMSKLKRRLRALEAALSTLEEPCPPWSPVRKWLRRVREDKEREVLAIQQQIEQLRKITGPAPRVFRPRPATAADKRIAAQYRDVEATPEMM